MLRRILVSGLGSLVVLCLTVGAAQAQPFGGGSGTTLASPIAPTSVTATPVFDVYTTGFHCQYGAGASDFSYDSHGYTETYMQGSKTFTNFESGCVSNDGGTTVTHRELGVRRCVDASAPVYTPGEVASFADGEVVIVCDVPDVNAAGHSRANSHKFKFVAQGFKCEATVGTGATGDHATNLRNMDSIEFDQIYRRSYRSPKLAAITTACIGTVPASTPVSSAVSYHELGCAEDNPFGSGTIRGYGETFTFPDRQYEELCQVPNYPIAS